MKSPICRFFADVTGNPTETKWGPGPDIWDYSVPAFRSCGHAGVGRWTNWLRGATSLRTRSECTPSNSRRSRSTDWVVRTAPRTRTVWHIVDEHGRRTCVAALNRETDRSVEEVQRRRQIGLDGDRNRNLAKVHRDCHRKQSIDCENIIVCIG